MLYILYHSVVITLFARLYVTDGWHFTHTWISLALPHHSVKGKAWVHKTSLIPVLIIEVPVSCPKSAIYRFRKYSDSLVFFYITGRTVLLQQNDTVYIT
jgi:hypothetical protein